MIDLNKQQEIRQCIEAFYFGYREFTARPDRILEQRGLGRVHHRILYFVGQNPGIGVGGLLDILEISKQALNAPLRQLIAMSLVENSVADHDRRIRQLALTESGRELEAELTRVQISLLASIFESLPAQVEQDWLLVMNTLARQQDGDHC
jgi:DNA-binding MarR family transcriptional regulator